MHRYDGTGPLRYRAFNFFRIYLKGVDVCVDEHRERITCENDIYGGYERVRRYDHFIAGTYVERADTGEQRTGAICGGKTMLCASHRRVRGFELIHAAAIATAPFPAADNLDHRRLFAFVGHRPGRERLSANG